MLYRLPCVTNTVVCRRSAALPARGYYSSTEQTWGKPAPIILIVIMNSIIIILIIITTNIIIILIRTSIIIVDTMFTNTILFLWRYTAWFDMGILDGNPIQYFSPRPNILRTSDCLSQIYSQPDIRIMPPVNIFPLSDISRCSGTDLSAPIYWDIWRRVGEPGLRVNSMWQNLLNLNFLHLLSLFNYWGRPSVVSVCKSEVDLEFLPKMSWCRRCGRCSGYQLTPPQLHQRCKYNRPHSMFGLCISYWPASHILEKYHCHICWGYLYWV